MKRTLEQLVRPNILRLKPYSSARDEYSGKEASVFLDANENPYNDPNNRYPDPMQRELKTALGRIKQVPPACVFLGNGGQPALQPFAGRSYFCGGELFFCTLFINSS